MKKERYSTFFLACTLILGIFLGAGTAFAADEMVDIIVSVDKPYADVVSYVKKLGGEVKFEYKYIDAIAISIPRREFDVLNRHEGIKHLSKDLTMKLPEVSKRFKEGYGEVPNKVELTGATTQVLTKSDLADLRDLQEGLVTDVITTRAADFWDATGHLGEGVIIGIMDTGVNEVSSIAGRVLGGENFTGDGYDANSPSNISHGTNVATAAGANALIFLPDGHYWAVAFETHIPGSTIPNYLGSGLTAIPMLGTAPFAEFYSLKIFNVFGSTSNSIILAAFDHAIDVKTKYNNGQPGGINLQVLNGSFGGLTLNAGDDPFFGAMVAMLQDVGIVTCFSAGNEGPSSLTIGDPGAGKNNLTVGATSIPEYERIAYDIIYGPPIGSLWRANDVHMVAEFSSRGPNADGRCDPEIVAPGDWIFMQSPNGFITIGSGTSFSSPMVAGAAACLISAHPGATQNEVRAALLAGANPYAVQDNSGMESQGYGFLDLYAAEMAWGAVNPADVGLASPSLHDNIKYACNNNIKLVQSNNFYRETDWMIPGERTEYFIDVGYKSAGYSITINVTQENAPVDQNQLFGDDLEVSVVSALTSRAETLAFGFVGTSTSITLTEDMLDFGIVRVTLMGDYTNAGRVKAEIYIEELNQHPNLSPLATDEIAQGWSHLYGVNVPEEKTDVDFALVWDHDWASYPTNDLDVVIWDITNGGIFFASAATLDTPERMTIPSLPAGQYIVQVIGFTVWDDFETYTLYADLDALAKLGPKEAEDMLTTLMPTEVSLEQNYPNPFNPETSISYSLPEAANVQLQIFDIRGALVKTLVNSEMASGTHNSVWLGDNTSGMKVSTGMYFYVLKTGNKVMKKSMLLLK
ncbi:MAG: T9SS C-terminal target domain-containing protein [Calditrichaeota bacterium]|nr:MAG: T9SS C-terminal target domain-containing protein [Calditrichota bacterium]